MKLNILPRFEITLPVTKKSVKFRPFVMKEEKLLLMASESEDLNSILHALEETVSACSFGEVTCDQYPLVDVQYLFLAIRGKSVSEQMEFNLVCGECRNAIPGTINVEDVKVQFHDNHNTKIKITEDVEVTMRYPQLKHLGILSKEDASLDDIYDVVAECIQIIKTADEVYESSNATLADMREFVDNLTAMQFAKLKEFFDTMPEITHTIKFTCLKCNTDNVIKMDEIANFFV